MKEKQDSQETVLIYDVSNKTPIAAKPKLTVGYVFNELFAPQTAQAANPIAIGTGKALMYGSGMLIGIIAGNKAVEDYKNYQLFSNYSRDYTPYAPEGSYLPALTGNLMLSGANAGLFANPIDQMRFDGTIPEVDTPQTTRNNNEHASSREQGRNYAKRMACVEVFRNYPSAQSKQLLVPPDRPPLEIPDGLWV